MSVKETLKREIDSLPEEMLKEIYDFVKFLEFKIEKEMLSKASQRLSGSSFQRIWGNELIKEVSLKKGQQKGWAFLEPRVRTIPRCSGFFLTLLSLASNRLI